MKNKRLIVFSVVALSVLLNQLVSSQSVDDANDSKINKYEVGGQVTVLRPKSYEDNSLIFDLNYIGTGNYRRLADNHQTEYGFGGRFTYNFNKNVAVEVEANYFPVDRLSRAGKERDQLLGTNEFLRVFVEPQGRKFQAVLGPKIGYRWKNFGLFGKVRPGLLYVERFPATKFLSFSPAGIGSRDEKALFFATDVGGVVEFYPSKRTVLRFDIGDTIIVYKAGIQPKQFNPGFTRHTFQFSTGFGFRF